MNGDVGAPTVEGALDERVLVLVGGVVPQWGDFELGHAALVCFDGVIVIQQSSERKYFCDSFSDSTSGVHFNAMEPKKMGRPPTPPEQKLEQRSIRLTAAQWSKIDQFGLPWLRGLIDRAKSPPKPPEGS